MKVQNYTKNGPRDITINISSKINNLKKGIKCSFSIVISNCFLGKLKSRQSGLFSVSRVHYNGEIEISHPERGTFGVNGNRLKSYNICAGIGKEFYSLTKPQ